MQYPVTSDGRYFIVRRRPWRTTNPGLSTQERDRLTKELMTARRAIGAALHGRDDAALQAARRQVHTAKVALGEQGPVW